MIDLFLKKIITLLNKPTHYLYVGGAFCILGKHYHSSNLLIMGITFICLALAYYTDSLYNNLYKIYKAHKLTCNKEKLKQKFINEITEEYESLGQLEKKFIKHKALNNSLIININEIENDIELNRIQTIVYRGWGTYDDSHNMFLFNKEILKILQKYLKNSDSNNLKKGINVSIS